MEYYQLCPRSSHHDSLKVLEADIQRANMLAASIPRAEDSTCLQMKLIYNRFASVFWFLLQWVDCSCTSLLPSYLNLFHIVVYKVSSDGKPTICSQSHGRRATIREFYAVILPSLQRLHGSTSELDINQDENQDFEMTKRKQSDVDLEREDECGICLEPCTKMVLPTAVMQCASIATMIGT